MDDEIFGDDDDLAGRVGSFQFPQCYLRFFLKHWEITKTIGFNMMTWMIRGYPPFGKPPFSHSPLIIDISCQNIHSISWLEATTTLKMEWGMTLRTLQALHLGLSSIETDLSNFKKRSLA